MSRRRGLLRRELGFPGVGRLWEKIMACEIELVVRKAVREAIVTVDSVCAGRETSSGFSGHQLGHFTMFLSNSPKTTEQRRHVYLHITAIRRRF
jgi:hypothetical protein